MVETVASGAEDKLLDSLSFKTPHSASYVVERKSVSFHPSGSNVYSSAGGTKLIKIVITGDNWLDPSTFRIMFDLRNNEATAAKLLRPLGQPSSFFRRMRIIANGAIIEDIDNYNRCSELFSMMVAKDSRTNSNAEAWGDVDTYSAPTVDTISGIPGGDARTVLFKPLSGFFSLDKYLPLRYMGSLQIELELVNASTDPILSNLEGDGTFADTNTSLKWQIENVQVKCDLCTLDTGLQNSYADHLSKGGEFPIAYNTYVSQTQSLFSGTNGQQKVRLNVTRALSRLTHLFITLDKSIAATNVVLKDWNSFYSPMEGKSVFDSSGEIADFQIQLGSKLYPEYPIRSHSEAYYQLKKALGQQSSNLHSFDIDSEDYRARKFVLGISMEKVSEAAFTGVNTRSGDILNIRFDHKTQTATEWATGMHIVLVSENVLILKDSGVEVHD
jgi:hypothetical protein